jgi:hypothetical protein
MVKQMKNKKYIVILTILIAFIVPLQSFAKSFDLNIKYDGKNISMESETPDTSWTLSNLLPGQSDTSSVTIKNSGVETVTLETQISIEENNGLLDAINLTVTNKAGTEVYTGKYTDLKTLEVSLAPGATETYTVKTSMRVDAGNEYQNKQYKLRFNFVATADELVGTLTIRYVDQDGKDIIEPTIETNYITETYDYTNQTPKDFSSLGYTYTGKVDGKLSGNYDMVIGDRLSLDYFKENKRIFHGFGNKLVRKLINIIFKSNINDIMTGYRAFSYRFVKTFPILSRGFEIETEMTIHALDKNISIKEIPVNYKDRPSGSISKLNTFKDGIKVLKTIFNLFIEYKPLTFFAIISILLMTGSLVMFIPVLNEYLQTGLVPKFPTLIVSVFLSIIAILLLMCGIILNVVIKKDRKLYEYFNLSIKTKK